MPKSTIDLKRWGNVLSHCVGAYGPYVKSGRSVIVGVFMQGEAKYTVEIVNGPNWECSQFYGLKNSSPPPEFKRVIMEEIGDAVL